MSLPIAFQLFSLRTLLWEDTAGTLKKLGKTGMGYDGVETAGLHGHSAKEFRAMCDEAGLKIVSAHMSYDAFVNDIDKSIADCKALGCKYAVIPYMFPDRLPGEPLFDETAENMISAGKALRENGIRMLYHNHELEFVKIDGKLRLDILYDRVGPDCMETEIDTGWAKFSGIDPASYLLKYSGRSPVVHIKDIYMNNPNADGSEGMILLDEKRRERVGLEFRPAGDGILDIPAILDAAVKAGTSYIVIEQDEPSMGLNAIESAARSRENLRKIGW